MGTVFEVSSLISCRYATTTIVSRKENSNHQAETSEFSVRFPSNAFITEFSMIIDGTQIVGKVTDKSARQHSHLFNHNSNVAIECKDKNNFGAMQLFSVKANLDSGSTAEFRLSYQELLERRENLLRQVIYVPERTDGDSVKASIRLVEVAPYKQLKVVTFTEKLDYLSNGELAKLDQSENAEINYTKINGCFVADVSWIPKDGDNKEVNLAVLYELREPDAIQFLTSESFFLCLVNCSAQNKIRRKETVFVLDSSGSMSGATKLEQVKQAICQSITDLPMGDKFNLITFAERAKKWKVVSLPASDAVKSDAKTFLEGLQPKGGTNLEEGLKLGAELLRKRVKKSSRLGVGAAPGLSLQLILVSDGEPTVGEMNPEEILRCLLDKEVLTVHTVALGKRADYRLLRRIAMRTGGETVRILDEDRIASQMQKFLTEIQSSVMADVTLEMRLDSEAGEKIDGVDISSNQRKDLCLGRDRVITGKLSLQPDTEISAFGIVSMENAAGERIVQGAHRIMVSDWELWKGLPEFAPKNLKETLERIWAFSRVKHLLGKAKYGEPYVRRQMDLREQAKIISLKYHFVSEMTEMTIPENLCVGPLTPKEENLFHGTDSTSPKRARSLQSLVIFQDKCSLDTSLSLAASNEEISSKGIVVHDSCSTEATMSEDTDTDLDKSEYISARGDLSSVANESPESPLSFSTWPIIFVAVSLAIIGFLLGRCL